MKKAYLIIIIAIFIMVIFCFYYGFHNIKNVYFGNISKITENNSSIEQQINITNSKSDNTTEEEFVIMPSDYVIDHINWSNYPDLKKGYIFCSEITYTKEVGRKFINIEINTEVISNKYNYSIIRNELSGVALEAKTLYGPSASVDVFATNNGAAYMSSGCILPYNMTLDDLNK
jgi:capsular polysaccharide biosynthesis protein